MSMSVQVAKWSSISPYLLSVLRIVAAFVFIQSGTSKMFAFPVGMPNGGTAELFTQIGIGGTLEIICGSLLLIGLFSRAAAFLMSGQMAVAYFQFHFPTSFWTAINHGAPAVLFCFIWLYISAVGPGPWSVDAIWRRRRTKLG